MTDIRAEIVEIEQLVKALLDGRFTKNEAHGRLVEIWGLVRRLKSHFGEERSATPG
jgi:hypothetical protein